MPDYYSLLVQKIREAETDSGKLRELVYEAARLALKRHVNVHYPALSLQDGKRLLADLEAAIERLEADEGGAVDRPAVHGESEPVFSFTPNQNDRSPEAISQETEHREDARPAIGPRPLQDGAGLLDWPLAESRNEPDSHDLILVPNQSAPVNRGTAYSVHPNSYSSTRNDSWWEQARPRSVSRRTILIGVGIASHIAVVILAGTAFYITVTGRVTSPPATVQDVAASPPQQPAKSLTVRRLNANSGSAVEPLTTASFVSAETATTASAAIELSSTFPRPTAYGVYAISNNRLIELEPISPTLVDPRVRNSLQIAKPSRTVINDAKLSFIAYRRDLTTSAPEKVSIRIAARIARAMTVDPLGKAVMEPPPTESWLIREFGYDLRVSPVQENSEMMILRPEYEEFTFPPGRYELVLGGQAYDFGIAGIITDPAQCVEGVTTPRGPAFYECRTP